MTPTSPSDEYPAEFDFLKPGPTVEEAIQANLEDFLEKRRASGDARPCGPHSLLPIYCGLFGIEKGELKEESFVSRVRRSGLGGSWEGPQSSQKTRAAVKGEGSKAGVAEKDKGGKKK